jgi:hypothetical protein
MICHDVMEEYSRKVQNFRCEWCGPTVEDPYSFKNSDNVLKESVPMVKRNRKEWGLEGLVGDLSAVIINTQEENLFHAAKELLNFTGLKLHSAFEGPEMRNIILKVEGSADFIVRNRKNKPSPFRGYNVGPKTSHFPDTRLETFVFETPNIEKYVEIQRERGIRFMTEQIVHHENYSFIQTIPSCFTGNSIGLIQWKGSKGEYMDNADIGIGNVPEKEEQGYLKNIKYLDHAATRLECLNRDAGIIEFMELTNYNFDFAIYVKSFNSITNVARLTKGTYAQVFTSGIEPFKTLETSGPTEKYIHNYGPRVHHVAFHTENIEDTFEGLLQDGMRFLLELVGEPDEGLKQTFTKGSPHTFLVNEYIHRYGDFDGFFTKSNVTDLTRATDAQ